MREELSSSEGLVLRRATRRNIPKYAILHSYRLENLKSYTEFCVVLAIADSTQMHVYSHIKMLRYETDHMKLQLVVLELSK
jgi:hypothetical protein